ncbi:hypothetical protein [Mannheimia haemolytica]
MKKSFLSLLVLGTTMALAACDQAKEAAQSTTDKAVEVKRSCS